MSEGKIKNLVEVVGIAAIVISLGFVAYEVRQNTNAIRSTVIHSISQQSIDSISIVLENPELRGSLVAVRTGRATEDDQQVVDLMFSSLLRIQLNRFLQSEIGVIDRDMVLSVGGRRGGSVYGEQVFIEYWKLNKSDYTEDFQAYMDHYVIPE